MLRCGYGREHLDNGTALSVMEADDQIPLSPRVTLIEHVVTAAELLLRNREAVKPEAVTQHADAEIIPSHVLRHDNRYDHVAGHGELTTDFIQYDNDDDFNDVTSYYDSLPNPLLEKITVLDVIEEVTEEETRTESPPCEKSDFQQCDALSSTQQTTYSKNSASCTDSLDDSKISLSDNNVEDNQALEKRTETDNLTSLFSSNKSNNTDISSSAAETTLTSSTKKPKKKLYSKKENCSGNIDTKRHLSLYESLHRQQKLLFIQLELARLRNQINSHKLRTNEVYLCRQKYAQDPSIKHKATKYTISRLNNSIDRSLKSVKNISTQTVEKEHDKYLELLLKYYLIP